MIYSKKKNFIFIHVYKNAGTSVKDLLAPYSDTFNKRRYCDSLLRKFGVKSNFAPRPHISALQVKKILGDEIWDNAYTFAVVRNPWDWQVSLYSFISQTKSHHQCKLVSGMKSFDDYIAWRCQHDFHTQSEYLMDDLSETLLVKDVFKFESIDRGIQRLGSHIGCEVRLKKLNQSRHETYRQYYSDMSREMVRKFFKEDIDRFGYDF